MSNTGPTKITADDAKKFQAILKLPAGQEKTRLQQELSVEEKAKFQTYVAIIRKKQEVQKQEKGIEETKARIEARDAKLQEAQAKLAALQIREAELVQQDKAILTQAAAQYAKKLDSVTKPAAAVTTGTPTLKY